MAYVAGRPGLSPWNGRVKAVGMPRGILPNAVTGKGGNTMESQVINYETMLKVARSISHSKDPEEVALLTVDSIKTALGVKGCALGNGIWRAKRAGRPRPCDLSAEGCRLRWRTL